MKFRSEMYRSFRTRIERHRGLRRQLLRVLFWTLAPFAYAGMVFAPIALMGMPVQYFHHPDRIGLVVLAGICLCASTLVGLLAREMAEATRRGELPVDDCLAAIGLLLGVLVVNAMYFA